MSVGSERLSATMQEAMPQQVTREAIPLRDEAPNVNWREWISFVGSVLGTAVVVSVVLGAVVLVLNAGGA